MSPDRAHPRHRLDELIHTPVRLSIMAALAAAASVDFRYLRDLIEVSDSLLSKHLSVLEDAGYVDVDKRFEGKRPRTWLSLTDHGRDAYGSYVRALTALTAPDARGDERDAGGTTVPGTESIRDVQPRSR